MHAAFADGPAPGHSPYAGQQSREIKTLSPAEREGYLQGKGMGFAKAAELNHFPGPAHVLELAGELQLTDEQTARTREIHAHMQREAQRLGRALVEKERHLDELFAAERVTSRSLNTLLREIGLIQTDLRQVHLQAHLEQKMVLTPEQVAKYDVLCGYTGIAHQHDPGAHHAH